MAAGAARHVRALGFVAVAVAVLVFSGGWAHGRMTLDGVGAVLHLHIAFDQWLSTGRISYWLPNMWAGTPAWNLAPSLSTVELVPLATLVSPEAALRIATLAAQVVGGWGAIVLGRALWGRRSVAAIVAGVVYSLHPLFITHGALFGHETSAWVFAATPWLAWSFRAAVRDGSARFAVLAGLVAAFAILHQAEHGYALVIMCLLMAAVEVARRRGAGLLTAAKAVLVPAAITSGVALGAIAYWLVPFVANQHAFVLTPPWEARAALLDSPLGREPGIWVTRSHGLHGAISFDELVRDLPLHAGSAHGAFYLGTVCLALTVASVFLLLRRDGDGHLTAILVASALAVWISGGGVALASTHIVKGGNPLPLAAIAVVAGALVWAFLRRLGVPTGWCAAAVGATVLAIPYTTPFLLLQAVVPFMANLRFPRFYPLAILGLSLGTAYPIVRFREWSAARRLPRAPLLSVALTAAIVLAFFVDLAPYWSYYRLHPPDGTAAYRDAIANLQAAGGSFRVSPSGVGDPGPVAALLAGGFQLSTGWPHPMASKELWRLTTEATASPLSYREAAFGLSGTAYITSEQLDAHEQTITGVTVHRNPAALPIVRAYDAAVVVDDENITPELAVALASRHIGVVTGGTDVSRDLGTIPRDTVGPDACGEQSSGRVGAASSPALAREVVMACAMHKWVGVYTGFETLASPGGAAVFDAPLNGLHGISVWLDRSADGTELSLHTVQPDGSIGPELFRVPGSAGDGTDLTTFAFDALPDSGGRRYAFFLTCPHCSPADDPRMVVAEAHRAPGDLLQNGFVNKGRAVAFSLDYDEMPEVAPSGTELTPSNPSPGVWRVQTQSTKASIVTVAESHFPGWSVEVDGRPARLLQVDAAFIGAVVPSGHHVVTFRYHKPAAAGVGLVITFATLVLAGVVLFRRERSRRSRREPVQPLRLVGSEEPAGPGGGAGDAAHTV